ncbi:MAG: NAD(P)-dependent alcohol dehydrogenase [Klebsiella michiganensis]|nr:NAD(P)-dependent alcohol dehydrogenase [Klebsiella michiganensis]MDU3965697.1 NAD(P)-dependent alcohol dehydrogenase [Klebsiella michiganensis]MDU4010954.1 NAD(P)-dependent alcohol dehydrogenase [Klebsiella michiganensis]HDX8751189.1 NAD(P)-dependent alcohol dehydrogenase [Klebsiella michiganensis]HDX9093878.1 NAD(P)-dependent alcohol dehydrogenase [Klebsiella michiganensis]
MKTFGYAAQNAQSGLAPMSFERRALRDDDLAIEINYCGVCHSDLHQIRDDWRSWNPTVYPSIPGHEIIGTVIEVGPNVTHYKIGDAVAVGTIVDSCRVCDQCRRGEEQMCREFPTMTYNSSDRHDGKTTLGGYSKHIIVREEFVLRMPEGLDAARAAPLLCAGITVYSLLRTWNVGPGSRVGVIGIGGLGHLAVKFAAGLGAHVTVITRTEAKTAEARALGADTTLISNSDDAMKAATSSFDVIIDTIPVEHDVSAYVQLLDVEGALVIVGALGNMAGFNSLPLIMGRRCITGSPSGGIAETQEMLDFCGKTGILPECEMIAIAEINEAFERMERGEVHYRFVIDMATLSDA